MPQFSSSVTHLTGRRPEAGLHCIVERGLFRCWVKDCDELVVFEFENIAVSCSH
jgi:hypothetical protein